MRIIIDCNNLGHTMFSAMGPSRKGIYGFLNQVLLLSKKFNTCNLIFCWDSKESYRKEVYPQYKANRRDNLDEFQLDYLKRAHKQFIILQEEILPSMGFQNIFIQEGYEADDLIGWITYRLPEESIIVSSDHDLWQLLSDDKFNPVEIYCLKKKSVFTVKDFIIGCEGLSPAVWQKVKAIAGCSSDNVTGVKGVGELTAIRYLAKTLRKGKIKQRIDNSQDLITKNLSLVTLPFHGKEEIDIALNEESFTKNQFRSAFQKYNLPSFLKGGVGQWAHFFGEGEVKKETSKKEKSVKISKKITRIKPFAL